MLIRFVDKSSSARSSSLSVPFFFSSHHHDRDTVFRKWRAGKLKSVAVDPDFQSNSERSGGAQSSRIVRTKPPVLPPMST